MNKLFNSTTLRIIMLVLIAINVFLSARYAFHGDLVFHTDIGRDFLLFQEIDAKKIVLIGPRASGLPGAFHGPLWLYVNYPVYLLGGGNPAVVAWFWVILNCTFLFSVYHIVKKLFSQFAALVVVLLLSFFTIEYTRGMFNPHGALFLTLPVFYLFYRYREKMSFKTLLFMLLLVGGVIQFQMAVGVPLLLLLSSYIVYLIITKKKYAHLLAYLILVIPLSTWLLFDLRHDFTQIRSVMEYATTGKSEGFDAHGIIKDRLQNMASSGIHIVMSHLGWINIIIHYIILYCGFVMYKGKDGPHRTVFLLLLFYYAGYWVLTMFHKGGMLTHYYIPMIPIPMILFVASVLYFRKKALYLLLAFIIAWNAFTTFQMARKDHEFIAKNESSWRSQYSVAERAFSLPDKEWGYYIYTPDQLSYSTKYAMTYGMRKYPEKKAHPYSKQPVTYLIIAPAPKDFPHLDGSWWKTNMVHITKKPAAVYKLPNGYKIEKYLLNEEELTVSASPDIYSDVHLR